MIKNTVDQKVKEEMEKLSKREEEIFAPVKELKIIHDDLVIIHRLEHIDILTFLDLAEKHITERRRSSWYGKILAVSSVDCGVKYN